VVEVLGLSYDRPPFTDDRRLDGRAAEHEQHGAGRDDARRAPLERRYRLTAGTDGAAKR
jgi:hypothetical protein